MGNLTLEHFLKEYYGADLTEPTQKEMETVAQNHQAILQEGCVEVLTELQKVLVDGLNVCGVPKGEAVVAMLMLKTEEQQWAMADYLEDVIYNPPSSETIMQQVMRITQTVANGIAEVYCPVYGGNITQYDCDEITCALKLGFYLNDGLPPLLPFSTVKSRERLCRACARNSNIGKN